MPGGPSGPCVEASCLAEAMSQEPSSVRATEVPALRSYLERRVLRLTKRLTGAEADEIRALVPLDAKRRAVEGEALRLMRRHHAGLSGRHSARTQKLMSAKLRKMVDADEIEPVAEFQPLPADEVWRFEAIDGPLAAIGGYAIVRDGVIVWATVIERS